MVWYVFHNSPRSKSESKNVIHCVEAGRCESGITSWNAVIVKCWKGDTTYYGVRTFYSFPNTTLRVQLKLFFTPLFMPREVQLPVYNVIKLSIVC
jgi:hypothetical protein